MRDETEFRYILFGEDKDAPYINGAYRTKKEALSAYNQMGEPDNEEEIILAEIIFSKKGKDVVKAVLL